MATTTLTGNSTGFANAWQIGAGTRPSLITSDDGDTSYVAANGATGAPVAEHYGLTALPGRPALISRVEQFAKVARGGGTNQIYSAFLSDASGNRNIAQSAGIGTGTYTLHSFDHSDSRPNGGVWGLGDFVAADQYEMALEASDNDTSFTKWTYGYVEVDWSPEGGGFAFLVAQWLLPLLGVASHAVSTMEIRQLLRALRTRPTSRDEFERIKAALLRRPVVV